MTRTSNASAFLGPTTHYGTTGPVAASFGLFVDPVISLCEIASGAVAVGDVVAPRTGGYVYDVDTHKMQFKSVATAAPAGQDNNGIRGVALDAGTAAAGDKVRILWQGVVTVKAATSTAATSPLFHDRTGAVVSLAAAEEPVWGYALTAESGGTLTALWFCVPIGSKVTP